MPTFHPKKRHEVIARMLHPGDEVGFQAYCAFIEQETAIHDGAASVCVSTSQAVATGGGTAGIVKATLRQTQKGLISAQVMLALKWLDAHGKEVSERAASATVERCLKRVNAELTEGIGPVLASNIRTIFRAMKPVAHLWAAWLCEKEKGKKPLESIGWWCSVEDGALFLRLAEAFRVFAEAHAVLKHGQAWRIHLPEGTPELSITAHDADPQFLNILDWYFTGQEYRDR